MLLNTPPLPSRIIFPPSAALVDPVPDELPSANGSATPRDSEGTSAETLASPGPYSKLVSGPQKRP